MRRSRSIVNLAVVSLLTGLLGAAQASTASADTPAWVELTNSSSVPLESQNIATDGTGQHLLMSNWDHGLRMSEDYGATWLTLPNTSATDTPPKSGWGWTRASNDGTTAFVTRYVSRTAILSRVTISGVTDLTTPAHGSVWVFDTSATGAVVVASDDGYGLMKSTDSGATWIHIEGSPIAESWSDIKISADATHIAALAAAGVLYTSKDSGVTWTTHSNLPVVPTGGGWYYLTMSDSGQSLVIGYGGATAVDNSVYSSTNGGMTWVHAAALDAVAYWSIDASNSGQRIIVTSPAVSGHVFTSVDAGATWSQSAAPTAIWQGGAVSGDGAYMYAQVRDGSVYRLALGSEPTPRAPTKPVAKTVKFPAAGTAKVSWAGVISRGTPLLRYEYCRANCSKRSSWKSAGLRTYINVKHLSKWHRYTFRVRAVNAVGRSSVTVIKFTQRK